MILYFSGTGNSRYVAEELADKLASDLRFIPHISSNILEHSEIGDYGLGFVFPVYSWGVPPIILEFISNIKERIIERLISEKVDIWAVITCGDEVARAPEMLKKQLESSGLTLKGIWSVTMPNNYVILPGFGIDSKELENEKLKKAPFRIQEISDHIKAKHWQRDVVAGSYPEIKTKLVYPLFKHWGIFSSKWRSTEECIGCGKCERICPINSVRLKDGKPRWGKECLSCLACYHICPKNAIQYGNLTKGKGQYFCPKDDRR